MKKILFPTDFSPTAKNAFEYALYLAAEIGGTIDVISVYQIPLTFGADVPTEYIDNMLAEKEESVVQDLKEFTRGAAETLLGKTEPVFGVFVPQEITDFAKKNKCDLMVMGTKGQHNLVENLLGSITTNTMMIAPCPVLAIPENTDFEEIRRIAYATDFHPDDEHAIEKLVEFADEFGSEVYFVHVEKDPAIGAIKDFVVVKDYPFKFTDFSVVNNPDVLDGLDDFIKKKEINLLALFIPRRRLWERLFHSSFTKKMTFHTSIPLLVFHG